MINVWAKNSTIATIDRLLEGVSPTGEGLVRLYDIAMQLGRVDQEPFTTLAGLYSEVIDISRDEKVSPSGWEFDHTALMKDFCSREKELLISLYRELRDYVSVISDES